MEAVTKLMTDVFSQVQTAGLAIMTAAIGLGVIFIGGKWLWGKTRQWLSRV
jgi:hypothetical protein